MTSARIHTLLFVSLLALYCLWLLSLPLLPTQDGPMHLYLATVFSSLLSGAHTFTPYYYIRHYLPPYAVHYYLLVALGRLFTFPVADKLVACLIFIVTATGFRALARRLGPSGGLASLFLIPLLIHWSFLMGFFNYCLALGFALFAIVFWLDAARTGQHRFFLAYLALLLLTLLTHPVPAGLIVCFAWLYLALSRWGNPAQADPGRQLPAPSLRSLIYALLGTASLGYLALFREPKVAVAPDLVSHEENLSKLLQLSHLSPFAGRHLATYGHRLGLYLLLFASLAAASRGVIRRLRARQLSSADVVLISSLMLLFALPFLPEQINSTHAFASRLVPVAWMLALAAVAGSHPPRGRTATALAALAVVAGLAVLLLADTRLRPLAHIYAQAEAQRPALAPGEGMLLLSTGSIPEPSDLTFNSNDWVSVSAARRDSATLLDPPWLDSPIIPIADHFDVMAGASAAITLQFNGGMYRLLEQSAEARARILPRTSAMVFPLTEHRAVPTLAEMQRMIHAVDRDEPARSWLCTATAIDFLCRSAGPLVQPGLSGIR